MYVLLRNVTKKSFHRIVDLNQHLRLTHKNFTIYKCDVCYAMFDTAEKLSLHHSSKNHHNDDHQGANAKQAELVKSCTICSKKFGTIATFIVHMQTHEEKNGNPNSKPNYNIGLNKIHVENLHEIQKIRESKMMIKVQTTTTNSSSLHTCDLCNKKFLNIRNLRIHRRIAHKRESIYKCDICDILCENRNKFQQHMRIHPEERTYRCQICLKGFSHIANMYRHVSRVHDCKKKIHICTVDTCKMGFETTKELQIHARSHSHHTMKIKNNEKLFKCSVIGCEKCFTNSSSLQLHSLIHATDKPFKCTDCSKLFKHKINLTLHRRVHTQKLVYKCKICGKVFASAANLSRHSLVHTGEKPYKCVLCDKRFNQPGHVTRHMQVHNTGDEEVFLQEYKCSSLGCNKIFHSLEELTTHLKSHKAKQFVCELCGCRFLFIEEFNDHCYKHELMNQQRKLEDINQRKLQANKFKYKQNKLKSSRHIPSASSALPSLSSQLQSQSFQPPPPLKNSKQCPICGRKFNKLAYLREHIRVHTGEKPFKCPIKGCNRRFAIKGNIRSHLRTHTGEKPFKCPEPGCMQRFGASTNLKVHCRKHGILEPFKCPQPECNKFFDNLRIMKIHSNIHLLPSGNKSLKTRSNIKTVNSEEGEEIRTDIVDGKNKIKKSMIISNEATSLSSSEKIKFDNENCKEIQQQQQHEKCESVNTATASTIDNQKLQNEIHIQHTNMFDEDKKEEKFVRSSDGGRNSIKDDFYTCPVKTCTFTFQELSELFSHIRSHNETQTEVEQEETDNVDQMKGKNGKKHNRKDHKLSYYRCLIKGCERKFMHSSKLRTHCHRIHSISGKSFVCSLKGCGNRFTFVHTLRIHEQMHRRHHHQNHNNFNEELYQCSTQMENCKEKENARRKKENSEKKEESHNRIAEHFQHDKMSHKCPIEGCNQCFTTFELLTAHCRTHNDDCAKKFSYDCSDCLAKFDKSSDLHIHNQQIHDRKKCMAIDCNRENQITSSRSTTGKKEKIPNDFVEKNLKSVIKKQDITTNSSTISVTSQLIYSSIATEEDKLYVCRFMGCGKRFKRPFELRIHTRTHTGEKPYSCSICNKNFVQHGHLAAHKRTHTGEKPYKCIECGRRFAQKTHLTAHMHTHTRDKASNLHVHIQTHNDDHENQSHKCLIQNCKKTFTQTTSLRLHLKNYHKKSYKWWQQQRKKLLTTKLSTM